MIVKLALGWEPKRMTIHDYFNENMLELKKMKKGTGVQVCRCPACGF